jgi:hypothetical protein
VLAKLGFVCISKPSKIGGVGEWYLKHNLNLYAYPCIFVIRAHANIFLLQWPVWLIISIFKHYKTSYLVDVILPQIRHAVLLVITEHSP